MSESVRCLDAILESDRLGMGMAVFSDDGRLILSNDAFSTAMETRSQQLLDTPMWDLLTEVETSDFTDKIPRKLHDWGVRTTRLHRSDGSVFPARLEIKPVRIDGDTSYLCTVQDLTSGWERTQELEQHVDLHNRSLDQLREAVLAWSPGEGVQLCNRAFFDLWGLRLHDFYRLEREKSLPQYIRHHLENPGSLPDLSSDLSGVREGELSLQEGGNLEYRATRQRIGDGQEVLLITFRDTTDQRLLRTKLEDLNHLRDQFHRASESDFWVVKQDGEGVEPIQRGIESRLSEALEVFYEDPSELVGFVHPEDRRDAGTFLNRLRSRTDLPFRGMFRLSVRGSDVRWVLAKVLIITDRLDGESRVGGYFEDVTPVVEHPKPERPQDLYDPISGLPNKALVQELVSRQYHRAQRENQYRFGLLFLRISIPPELLGQHGHPLRNRVLETVGKRISKQIRGTDAGGYYGDNQFLILASGIENPSQVNQLAERVLEQLRLPVDFEPDPEGEPVEVPIEVHTGIVINRESLSTAGPDELIQAARTSMKSAMDSDEHQHYHRNGSTEELVGSDSNS